MRRHGVLRRPRPVNIFAAQGLRRATPSAIQDPPRGIYPPEQALEYVEYLLAECPRLGFEHPEIGILEVRRDNLTVDESVNKRSVLR